MELASDSRPAVDGRGRRVAIVVARFNQAVTEKLLAGAQTALREAGVAKDAIAVVWVPGAFELPLAARWLIAAGGCDAVVALGAVIRGETDHYDYVCSETARGLAELMAATGVPIGFGLLTCDEPAQAFARAGGASGNKGQDAARAALEMLAVKDEIAAATGTR